MQGSNNAGRSPGADAQAAAPADSGSHPTNREPDTYIPGSGNTRILRFGVDSLYLSFYGEIFPDVDMALMERKHQAQSKDPFERCQAQWLGGEHVFEVSDRRQGNFAYVLQDNSFRIAVSSGYSNRGPLAYVKVSAEYLAHKGPDAVVEELAPLINELGDCDGWAQVSRADLFVDFVTDCDIGSFKTRDWITRADGIDTFTRKGEFSGWLIGSGGPLSFRLYNKTLEILKSNKTFLLELWKRGGWDGEQKVWRAEFQFRREVIWQLGIRSWKGFLESLGGMWQYAAQSWLRLAIPTEGDSNRGRWATHPLWDRLAAIAWRLDDVPLTRTFSMARVPQLDRLYRFSLSFITSYMAIRGIKGFAEGAAKFIEECQAFSEGRCRDIFGTEFEDWIAGEVASKKRRFSSGVNSRGLKTEKPASGEEESDAIDSDREPGDE
jgi:hypothetical protein